MTDYTYSPNDPDPQKASVALIRLKSGDRDLSSVAPGTPLEQRSALYTDVELLALLSAEGGSELRAAAAVLEAVASDRAMLVKMRKTGPETQVDYGDARKDLLALAKSYRDLAGPIPGGPGEPADGIAEVVWTDPDRTQVILNDWQRRSVG